MNGVLQLERNGPVVAPACGLVSQVKPYAQLLDTANELARKIAADPGHALRMAKRWLREGQPRRVGTLLEMSASLQALAHHAEQHEAAVDAFIEKRPPAFVDC